MAKKPRKKKKQEVSIEGLNPDTIAQETVAASVLGRLLASYGGILTKREEQNAQLLYHLGRANQYPPKDSPVVVQIDTKSKDRKCTPKEAIDWFVEAHPKLGKKILAKLESRSPTDVPIVKYGLQTGKDLPDEMYVSVLSRTLEIPYNIAHRLYHKTLKPARAAMEEESLLVEMAMKT